MTDTYLDRIYATQDQDRIRALYDEWSASYDTEITANGYATPARCAAALAAYAPDKTAPLLDFGCGTGLSGIALRAAGFETIDGVDPSPQMLALAREKNVYRNLTQIDANAPLTGNYSLMSAVGVIGPGAAPMSVLSILLHALPRDGKLVFSLNDHALAEAVNIGFLNEWLDCGAARLLFSEHGEHLPGRNLHSTIYVVEKA